MGAASVLGAEILEQTWAIFAREVQWWGILIQR